MKWKRYWRKFKKAGKDKSRMELDNPKRISKRRSMVVDGDIV